MIKVLCEQIHSANVHVVEKSDFGRVIPSCDGLITDIKNVRLIIQTADCAPISFQDPMKKVVGIVHAGWRGTEKEIVKNAINLMSLNFDSSPENIKVKIGPTIDKDNFIVRSDVKNKFKNYKEYFEKISDDQWKFDLVGVNIKQMLSVGILEKNINQSDISTYLNKKYPSYRRNKTSKRILTSVMVK